MTESNNVLKNVDVFLWARDKWLTAKFDADLYMNLTDNTVLAMHTMFDVPAFNMRNPNTTTLATFGGYLIEDYTPKRADWVTFTGGGIQGTASLSLNQFILESMRLNAIATFGITGISGEIILEYKRPSMYMIDM